MKKVLMLTTFFALAFAQINAQNWQNLSNDTIQGKVNYVINLGGSKSFGNKIMLAGAFTGTSSGIVSPGLIIFNNSSKNYEPVSGINLATDTITGFAWGKNDTLRLSGRFKIGSIRYCNIYLLPPYNTVHPYQKLRLFGPAASSALVEKMGIDSFGNTLLVGKNLVLGGISLIDSKVGYVDTLGNVKALPELTYTNSTPTTPEIKTIVRDTISNKWIIGGIFDHMRTTETPGGLCEWDGITVHPVDLTHKDSIGTTAYVMEYTGKGLVGWTGDTILNGTVSPGMFYLEDGNITGINGLKLKTTSMFSIKANVWIAGQKTHSSGANITTYNQITHGITNRQGNIPDSLLVLGITTVGGDTMIAYGPDWIKWALVANPDLPGPLPVTWVEFTATVFQKNQVLLKWATQYEKGNEGFFVQRSLDGKSWHELGFVPGHGNETGFHNYNWTDSNPFAGFNYYRLRQKDQDGKTDFSEVRVVYIGKTPSGVLNLSPNPAKEDVEIRFHSRTEARGAVLSVHDSSSKIVFYTSFDVSEGENQKALNARTLSPGTYTINIVFGNTSLSGRMVIAR